jgi:hypothetical protein
MWNWLDPILSELTERAIDALPRPLRIGCWAIIAMLVTALFGWAAYDLWLN